MRKPERAFWSKIRDTTNTIDITNIHWYSLGTKLLKIQKVEILMATPDWRETVVALPITGSRDDLTVTPVRFRGEIIQVLDSRDFQLPGNENLFFWLRPLKDLANEWEDATISYAEPFNGGTVSDISLVVTGWRYPTELEQELLFPLAGKTK